MRDAGGGHHGEEIKEWFTSVEFSYVALVLEGKLSIVKAEKMDQDYWCGKLMRASVNLLKKIMK